MYAERLKALRLEHGYTQTQAADLVGISGPSYSAYESGKSTPTLTTLIAYAEHYSVSLDWICGISERKSPDNNPSTYSDIISQLVSIEQNVWFNIHKTTLGGREGSVISIGDSIIQLFLSEWEGILELLHKGTINKKLYELWVADKVKEYGVPLGVEDEFVDFLNLKEAEHRS